MPWRCHEVVPNQASKVSFPPVPGLCFQTSSACTHLRSSNNVPTGAPLSPAPFCLGSRHHWWSVCFFLLALSHPSTGSSIFFPPNLPFITLPIYLLLDLSQPTDFLEVLLPRLPWETVPELLWNTGVQSPASQSLSRKYGLTSTCRHADSLHQQSHTLPAGICPQYLPLQNPLSVHSSPPSPPIPQSPAYVSADLEILLLSGPFCALSSPACPFSRPQLFYDLIEHRAVPFVHLSASPAARNPQQSCYVYPYSSSQSQG